MGQEGTDGMKMKIFWLKCSILAFVIVTSIYHSFRIVVMPAFYVSKGRGSVVEQSPLLF